MSTMCDAVWPIRHNMSMNIANSVIFIKFKLKKLFFQITCHKMFSILWSFKLYSTLFSTKNLKLLVQPPKITFANTNLLEFNSIPQSTEETCPDPTHVGKFHCHHHHHHHHHYWHIAINKWYLNKKCIYQKLWYPHSQL